MLLGFAYSLTTQVSTSISVKYDILTAKESHSCLTNMLPLQTLCFQIQKSAIAGRFLTMKQVMVGADVKDIEAYKMSNVALVGNCCSGQCNINPGYGSWKQKFVNAIEKQSNVKSTSSILPPPPK